MKTHDTEPSIGPNSPSVGPDLLRPSPIDRPSSSPTPVRPPKKARQFAGIGAVIAVALIVSLSAIVFAQLAQHRSGKQAPSAGQWQQVLKGYTVASLVAVPSNPSTLYACAVPSQNTPSSGQSASYTILRSTDYGSHWQNIGSSAALGGNCELAINPSNSNDVYAVGLTTAKPARNVLKHSTDGGQTWATITPTLHLAGTQATTLWNVQQISIEGNRLFGLQWMPIGALPANRDIEPAYTLSERLATSTDNGQTWTVIDGQFIAQNLSAHSYAVDPTNPNTIYDLLGGSFSPPIVRPAPTNDIYPAYGLNGELYKTTDGGLTWHLLRKDLTFGTQVQLATNKPNIIYVGGVIGPRPLPAESAGADNSSQTAIYPGYVGFFHLSMSGDGGATWRDITAPTNAWITRSWVVSPDGQVYLSPAITFNGATGSSASGSPATAVASTSVATVLPGNKGLVPPTAAQNGVGAPSTRSNQAPTPNVPPPAATVVVPTAPPQSQTIQRYDPTTNKWTQLTSPPASGILLAVTPTGTNNSVVLWFLGLINGNDILYRYVAE